MTENIYSFLPAQSSQALHYYIPDLTHSAPRDAALSWTLAAVGCAGGSALQAAGRGFPEDQDLLSMQPLPVGPQSFPCTSQGSHQTRPLMFLGVSGRGCRGLSGAGAHPWGVLLPGLMSPALSGARGLLCSLHSCCTAL